MTPSPEIAAALAADPAAKAAYDFANGGFVPRHGVDYKWVTEYAKSRYDESHATYKELDDKAATVANYLAGGAGIMTLGTIAAASASQISPWVVMMALPSLGCALVALDCALRARWTRPISPPPSVPDAVLWANHYGEHEGAAAAAFSAHLYLSVVLMRPALRDKAKWVDRAIGWLMAALGLLVVPVFVCIVSRLADPGCIPKAT